MIGPKMMNARQLLLIATASAVTLSLVATPSYAETLQDVIAYAYETNPGLQAQRAAVRAGDESYVQARAGYGLNVTASAGETSYEIRRDGAKADAINNNIGLSAVQPLYTGGRVRARVAESEAQILAAREQLRRYEMDVMLRVVAAYVGVRRDEQLLKIAQEAAEVLQRGLNDTQAKFDVKTVTITDLAQSRARLSQAQTQLINAREQLAVSRAQFLAVVGQNPGQLEPPPVLEPLPASIDQAFDAAENNNPQLLAAQYTEQGSRARIARAKANAMPSITARVDIQRTPLEPYRPGLYDNTRSASVVLTQPLFAAGQISSGIRQATEENNRDRLSIDETRLQLVQNVTQAWERVASLRQQLETLQEEVKSNELAFLGVRAEERFALRSNIEILNAIAELNSAQQNLTRARAGEYVGRVQLLALMGTLTPQVLSVGVEPYDPGRNFRRVKNRGVTPLELPVHILDAIGSVPIGKPRPASIAQARPAGSPPQPTPAPAAPTTSVLEIIKKDPAATTLPDS
ncbi:MAG TPA: TolC family outer membrane protein [Phenylobacterium sp.]|nr:TolC family outer membrane protein [Phenylobacterium sp.]